MPAQKTTIATTQHVERLVRELAKVREYRPTLVNVIMPTPEVMWEPHILLVENENGPGIACLQGEICVGESVNEASRRLCTDELGLAASDIVEVAHQHTHPYFNYRMPARIPDGFRRGKSYIFNLVVTSRTKFDEIAFPRVDNQITRARWHCLRDQVLSAALCGMADGKRVNYLEALDFVAKEFAAIKKDLMVAA